MVESSPMTRAGYERLQAELKDLKGPKRAAIIKEIEEARAHGDLSENAEYHAAREKYGQMQAKVGLIETRLATAEVVDTTNLSGEKVVFGAFVTLEEQDSLATVSYQIVGEDEGDVRQNKLSYKSPLARALIGKVINDEVTVSTPGGTRVYLLTRVSFA